MPRLHANTFITRQTADSRFSHSTLSWEELAAEVVTNFDKAKPSDFQPLALVVPVDPSNCRTGIVTLSSDSRLLSTFESRRDGEAPRKTVQAVAGRTAGKNKVQALSAYVVLYPSTLLAEKQYDDDGNVIAGSGEDNELEPVEGNWEMISLNASPTEEDTPIDPDTLQHNHFESDGGTATGLSDSEFVAALRESFTFWKDKAMLADR